MKTIAVFVLFAICAVVFAEDAPEDLYPCAFRMTAKVSVRSEDGEELATSLNEMIRDNGDYWVWKSQFSGNEFVHSFVEDHEWSIIWRPDTGKAYRHDIMARKCYTYPFDKQPTPYDWIQSKSYGIMWFDDVVDYKGSETTLHTAIIVGAYGDMDYESEINFYVNKSNAQLVYINGTFSAAKKEIRLILESTSLSFDHNEMIPPKTFAVSAPCDLVGPPEEPPADFKKKCYLHDSGASLLTVSWIALLVAVLVALLGF